jgi:hypothetical protein
MRYLGNHVLIPKQRFGFLSVYNFQSPYPWKPCSVISWFPEIKLFVATYLPIRFLETAHMSQYEPPPPQCDSNKEQSQGNKLQDEFQQRTTLLVTNKSTLELQRVSQEQIRPWLERRLQNAPRKVFNSSTYDSSAKWRVRDFRPSTSTHSRDNWYRAKTPYLEWQQAKEPFERPWKLPERVSDLISLEPSIKFTGKKLQHFLRTVSYRLINSIRAESILRLTAHLDSEVPSRCRCGNDDMTGNRGRWHPKNIPQVH